MAPQPPEMQTLNLNQSTKEMPRSRSLEKPRRSTNDMREMQEVEKKTVLTKPKAVHNEEKASAPQPTTNSANALQNFADYDELKSKYEDLKKEFRVATRENRDMFAELREVKHQNNSLLEACAAMQKDLNGNSSGGRGFTKNDRARYHEYFEMLSGKAEYYQHEFAKRENHLGYLTKQTREANEEKEQAEGENRQLQRKIRDLQAQLTECRDDLLRLQPPSQMSDSEFSDLYGNLCQQVATYVDDLTEDPDVLEKYFDELNSVNEMPPDLRTEINPRHLKLAKQNPESLPLLIQYIIHGRLKAEVLGPNIYVYGLEELNVMLLQGVEEGMSELEPKRDGPTLRRWRSETLQGLLKMEAFAEEQGRISQIFSQDLAKALSTVLSPSTPLPWQDLHKQIVLPAVKLANAIRVATTDYQFFSHLFARPSRSPTDVHRNEIGHYSMVDCATQKVIRQDSALKVDEDGKIGEEMFVVNPGMVRMTKEPGEGSERAERSVMVKPTILVKLDEPMGKKRGLKPPTAWGLGWLSGGAGQTIAED